MRTAGVVTLAMIVAFASVPLVVVPARGNGGEGKRVVYSGALEASAGGGKDVLFDAEIEPRLFKLTMVRDKYRVVRIRIRNTGLRPLVLSAGGDAVQVQLRNGSAVTGLLDLGARDAAVWDALDTDLRKVIVYPRVVQGGEEESVFVFLLAADSTDVPQVFRYTIASRPDRSVVIRDVSAAVKR